MIISARVLATPLRPEHATVGARVLHRQGQWTATILGVEEPFCWVHYDDDRARGLQRGKRVLRTDLAALERQEEEPTP